MRTPRLRSVLGMLAVLATLILLGCQTGTATRVAATTLTTAPPWTWWTVPEGTDQAGTAPTETGPEPSPTTRAGAAGDGICDPQDALDGHVDCDLEGMPDAEAAPAGSVPCGQTGAFCPPDSDAPVLAYDPAPARRWTALDEYLFEQRLRRMLRSLGQDRYRWSDAYLRSDWPRTRYGTYDHSWPSDPGPGSTSRPVQPYPAFGNDPNDADRDGVACEYGCKN